MYDVIKLETIIGDSYLESMSVHDIMNGAESVDLKMYTEAVFNNGKEKLEPLVEKMQAVKDLLLEKIKEHEGIVGEDGKKKHKRFNPELYWKNTVWKDLEDEFSKIFGFRTVIIEPFVEKYISKDKMFESKILNCFTYTSDRYPIEGLITDDGFYDKTKSINLHCVISLGCVKELTAKELVAVFLHEIGHNIDPALVLISYTGTNVLSKYMTDRVKKITGKEMSIMRRMINKKVKNNGHKSSLTEIGSLIIFYITFFIFYSFGLFLSTMKLSDRAIDKRLEKLKSKVESDTSENSKFDRQHYSEAFADNFARMYGYGPDLMNALKKLSLSFDNYMNSRINREGLRQRIIYNIAVDSLNDEHKTDIHRARNLINEYKKDIADPNIPPAVKKQLEEDLEELEKCLDSYMHDFSDMRNLVNKAINEELERIENEENKKSSKSNDVKKESFEFFEESKAAYEKLMKAKESLNSSERNEVKKCFGSEIACSFAKDKDGYYCYTHRCRSKSYPSIAEIPKKDVEFVRSTS